MQRKQWETLQKHLLELDSRKLVDADCRISVGLVFLKSNGVLVFHVYLAWMDIVGEVVIRGIVMI